MRIISAAFRNILLTAMLFPLLAPAAGIAQKKIRGQEFCDLYQLMTANRFSVQLASQSTVVSKRHITCIFNREQRRFLCGGTRVELFHAPVYEGNVPWISVLDWHKNMRPILYPATVPRQKITRIMIDMGHGGDDPGAIGRISKEKMITLRVGRRVAEILRSYGFQVSMTRNSDVYVPLDRIGNMQRQSGSDLFVSIHVNSTASSSVTGIETFCLTPAGAASSNGGKTSNTVYRGNKQDAANMLLAWNIQSALLKRTGAADRGVKHARFAVLRDIDAPGVLVEIGFISNRSEERRLNEQQYIDRIAYGIADGIVGFSRSTKVRQ
jgi:N-acetylmuramoyl-L-alanine amidase